ncbi:hypothetical protein VV02_05910 [Luteipulveratus mongoliensis]|uniref:Amino acid transporter n=1 Tax=Luteipulveratus mongoliensis TaxID=571913 RepID=A0A0K1JPN4_9MICO|nr:hypothetical protein VV02_05910 [Luteipulveratus mongoliensis]
MPLQRTAEEQAEEDAFQALYGAWAPMSPTELARELAGFDRPWWVVGGWAIEAATGYRREHEDIDISILACDVAHLVSFWTDRWHVWNNVGGVLHPLGRRWPTVDEPESQLWIRAHATAPWVADMPLTPDRDGLWTNKRMPSHVAPVEDVTWVAPDGIRYLNPEIVMLYKAALKRPKDDPDFEATLSVLTDERRRWLADALREVAPDHHWIARL